MRKPDDSFGYALRCKPPLTLSKTEAEATLKAIKSTILSQCGSPANEQATRKVAVKIQKWLAGEYR